MNAEELLDALGARGIARAGDGSSKVARTVVVESIRVEVALILSPDERGMRARWKERVGSSAISYLVIANDPDSQGAVLTLGLGRSDGAIRSVVAEDLGTAFQQACMRRNLEGVRHLTERIKLLGLTRHTRAKGGGDPEGADRQQSNTDQAIAP